MTKEKQTLYLECSSGISGDMTVAALLDLGADEETLMRALRSLPLEGYEAVISRVRKSGLDMCDFHVRLDEAHENHDHDMDYLHGQGHEKGHIHDHGGLCSHEHRGLPEIVHIIQSGELTDRAKELAVHIFEILAEAEAEAHGVPAEQVHFHEVGAVDSIVDIVAAAVCLDDLNIENVIVTRLCEGHGTIRCQHGTIPVPVPAVVNIVRNYRLPLHMTDVEGELVTPTGAAIVAAVCTSTELPEHFTIRKSGMGAGKRNYSCPGMLRAMLLETEEKGTENDLIYKLETNIDDCTGECLGYTMERLMEAGARDVHYIPVYMKKNRPAYQLNVICSKEDTERLEKIIFEETTTIGIRRIPMERSILARESRTVKTCLGEIRVKVCRLYGKEQYFPEYESVAALCRQHKKSYPEVCRMIRQNLY